MPYQLWSQDNFTKGELSPYMYARSQVEQYYDSLKQAQNVLTYPTGAAGKRFGTLLQNFLQNMTAADQLYLQTFQYLDICVFQLAFTPGNVAIYLEGLRVANLTDAFLQSTIAKLSTTTLGAIFRITGPQIVPHDLSVALDGGNTITGITSNQFTFATPIFVAMLVIPVQFANSGGALPTTSPQIVAGVTYFINTQTTSSGSIYTSAYEAKFLLNPITLTNIGTGTNTMYQLNVWSLSASTFKNLPIYDFNGLTTSYDALTFTPSATMGAGVTITVSGAGYPPLNSTYVGGAFIGAGGTSRITAVASATSFTVSVQKPFDSTDPIQGSLVFLAEPAWSNTRGWPQVCSSYQNRALFANTVSLPNGFWASTINNYTNFGNLTQDDDDAISWFPSSDNVNVINFIVPFRSITVHTNTGIYSSPLSEIAAITPSTFTLQLQDSTPADVLQPQAIDNQILILSGNDLHTMLWDGINNAYTSNIVSVVNEQTIRMPVDETAYADLRRAGSRYVFIINASGSMAVYQTLLTEQVAGLTPQIMEQSYGTAQFIQVCSSVDGRAWFAVQRQMATQQSAIAITGFTATTLAATASNFSTTLPTAIQFTTTGSLPASTPPLVVGTFYWAIGTDANDFQVYLDQNDALAAVNNVTFTSAGLTSDVVPFPLTTVFTLEELTHETYLDCAVYYNGAPTSTIATTPLFDAQQIAMVGDGFGFTAEGGNGEVTFNAHGQPVDVSVAYIGFPINTIMEPMPLTPPPGTNTTLTKPKHIRSIRFMFNNTIGGTINGVPIALQPFDEVPIGEPPFPARGIFELMVMSGWDDFNIPSFVIEHSDPFNIELIGVFYSVDT